MAGVLVMKFQARDYTCGIASIQNALLCIGIKKTQGQIMKLCHCDPDNGTPEEEIKRGLLACGAAYWEIQETKSIAAFACLHKALDEYGPVILCCDAWDHWLTVIGRCGARYIVFDPAKGAGIRVYDATGLSSRWRLGRKAGGPSYYALSVAPCEST